jgi:peptide/nickel transport system ATP-binding protein
VIHHPTHPYTAGLMASIPDLEDSRARLAQIDGSMPRLNAVPAGCAFHPRCRRADARCATERPELRLCGRTRAACWHPVDPGQRDEPAEGAA